MDRAELLYTFNTIMHLSYFVKHSYMKLFGISLNDVESINRPPVYLYYRLDSAFNARFTAAISQLSVIRQPQQLLFRQHHKQ